MTGKPDPATDSGWHAYYRQADERRRRAGWRRADEVRHHRKKRGRFDPARLIPFFVGLAAVVAAVAVLVPN